MIFFIIFSTKSLPYATLHALCAHYLKHFSVVSQNAHMFYLNRSYNNCDRQTEPKIVFSNNHYIKLYSTFKLNKFLESVIRKSRIALYNLFMLSSWTNQKRDIVLKNIIRKITVYSKRALIRKGGAIGRRALNPIIMVQDSSVINYKGILNSSVD